MFRISHPHIEGFFQASRPLFCRVLLDVKEMEELFSYLPPFVFYNVSQLVSKEAFCFSKQEFLEGYRHYVNILKEGKAFCFSLLKPLFSAVLSSTETSLYAMKVKEKYLIKKLEPTIQLSLHHFSFCKESKICHSMVNGKEVISWGLQFSYPTLYSNSKKGKVIEIMKQKTFPNNLLFRILRRFIRSRSQPVFFWVDGHRINSHMRLGNNCFKWIDTYKHLSQQGLKIEKKKSWL